MSKKKKSRTKPAPKESGSPAAAAAKNDEARPLPPVRPPRKNLAMLIFSATLLGIWLTFLLVTALTGW